MRVAVFCLMACTLNLASAQQIIKDESYADPTFVDFKVKLLQAVLHKDTSQLFALVSNDVRVSDEVCDKVPKSCFKDLFRSASQSSQAWDELYRMISYGFSKKKMKQTVPGYAYKGEIVFQAPSYHDRIPTNENTLLVTGQYVNVRSAPGATAPVLERLSFAELSYNHPLYSNSTTAYNLIDGKLWYEVILANGSKGYIIEDFVSASLGREISIKQVNGEWKIISFFKRMEPGC